MVKTQPEMPLAAFSLAFPLTRPEISTIRLPNGLNKHIGGGDGTLEADNEQEGQVERHRVD